MEIQVVQVEGLENIMQRMDEAISYIEVIEMWSNIIVWCIFVGLSAWLACWLWRTCFRSLLRTYFRLW